MASRAATRRSSPTPWLRLPPWDRPALWFAAGADAVELFETKAQTLLAQADAHRGLSSSLGHDDA
jgi:hypothetical protein